MLSPDQIQTINSCVLCWLATVDQHGMPNVSPKEAFTTFGTDQILIANIASPKSAKNVKENAKACVSVLDIFVQKGWQIKGVIELLSENDDHFSERAALLLEITQGKYPFQEIFQLQIESIKPIIAPSYFLFPNTTKEQRIASAMKTYGVEPVSD